MMPEPNICVPSTETELVDIVASFLAQDGYRVWLEVPNMGQSVDMVAQKNRWLTVIEAKLKDWRRALGQCQAHEMVADFVCVAYCSFAIPDSLYKEITRRGYGLIHFSKEYKTLQWLVHPRQNPNVWRPQRQRFISLMGSIDNAR